MASMCLSNCASETSAAASAAVSRREASRQDSPASSSWAVGSAASAAPVTSPEPVVELVDEPVDEWRGGRGGARGHLAALDRRRTAVDEAGDDEVGQAEGDQARDDHRGDAPTASEGLGRQGGHGTPPGSRSSQGPPPSIRTPRCPVASAGRIRRKYVQRGKWAARARPGTPRARAGTPRELPAALPRTLGEESGHRTAATPPRRHAWPATRCSSASRRSPARATPASAARPQQPTAGMATTDAMSAQQLEQMYQQQSAGPVQTGRLTLDDVVMKTAGLFALVLVGAVVGWQLAPTFGLLLVMGGIAITLVLGLVIAFKKTVSVPLIVLYAAVEGLLVGAVSQFYANAFDEPSTPVFQGIVAQAVLATLSVFAAMLILYTTRVIKVTNKFRRIVTMAVFGYAIFALINFGYAMISAASGSASAAPGASRHRHLALRHRPRGVLAGPRLRLDRARHRRRSAGEVLVAAGARPHRHAGLALPRDPAPAGPAAQRVAGRGDEGRRGAPEVARPRRGVDRAPTRGPAVAAAAAGLRVGSRCPLVRALLGELAERAPGARPRPGGRHGPAHRARARRVCRGPRRGAGGSARRPAQGAGLTGAVRAFAEAGALINVVDQCPSIATPVAGLS